VDIITLVLGPLENNTYLLIDPDTKNAAVVDPSFGHQEVLDEVARLGVTIKAIWLTHAHFDHIAGVAGLARDLNTEVEIGLHHDDLELWQNGGGAPALGYNFEVGIQPTRFFEDGQTLWLGNNQLNVLHAPGHTRGHVMFHAAVEKALLCGDVIFAGSIGRTDLPGGDTGTLLNTIRTRVLNLPPDTRLMSGHGPESTVEQEQRTNPFL